jgi:benzoyl-CoA reductase/2-hydroxyglutaryl-CoA dehydratase subunit BcrC/BadD/HgdB
MSGLDQLVEGALREPLAAARDHAQRGGRVIGYVGADIPVELIIAADAFPLRLPSFAVGSVAAADRYLESSFMPEVRSVCEQYLRGAFQFMPAIILPRSNDSAQRLYYYLSDLRSRGLASGPEPLIFDLAKIPRDSSRAHSRASVTRLASQIGTREEELPKAIAKRNRRRELFAAAAASRLTGGTGCGGSRMDRIFRAADLCDADTFDAKLHSWLQSERAARTTQPRVLLAGSAPPDERLHLAVEAGGGNVVAELGDHFSRSVALPLIPNTGSFAAIADHYQDSTLGPRAFADRAAEIGNLARSGSVTGVVNWLLEEEDALIWDLPAQAAALAAAGIASLALSRRRWDGGDGALEEITRFTGSLGKSS